MTHFPFKLIDLTHTLSPTIPTWDNTCGFNHQIQYDYDSSAPVQFRTHDIHMREGIGTHIDAPAHCFKNSITIDQLPLSDLLAPCIVIDVASIAHERFSLSVNDIKSFENIHGEIPPRHVVIIKTGWGKYWGNPEKYHNNHLFPCVSHEAALLLLDRNILGLGIDTLSPDRPDLGFPVHAALLGANKYIIENIANLDALPVIGSFILALPIKIENGTEAPVRLVAFVR
ncbi:MAG: cyclase family protein [Gammaproteobacteria bacterium]